MKPLCLILLLVILCGCVTPKKTTKFHATIRAEDLQTMSKQEIRDFSVCYFMLNEITNKDIQDVFMEKLLPKRFLKTND